MMFIFEWWNGVIRHRPPPPYKTFASNLRPDSAVIKQPNTVTQTVPPETPRPGGLVFPHMLRQIIVQAPDNLC